MANIADLFTHNRWANLALLDACSTLTDAQLDAVVPGTYGSTRATLLHLAGAERRYVQGLRGEARSPIPDLEAFPGFDALRASLEETGSDLESLAATLEGTDSLRRTFADADWVIEHRVVLVQAINHATEHRAHIMTTLTSAGVAPIDLDGWAWGEATGAAHKSS